jgi:hypothetical protein
MGRGRTKARGKALKMFGSSSKVCFYLLPS